MNFDLENYLKTLRPWIEKALTHYIETSPTQSDLLTKAMGYSLLAGGKRLRPVLVFAAAQACSEKNPLELKDQVLPVACALEMIHSYSLIHDDLPAMDNDDLRRGRPTNHKVFGEAIAILAGDALLTEAFAVITQTPTDKVPAATLVGIISDIADASGGNGMAGGQIIDLEAEGNPLKPEELEHLHRCKTGRLIAVAVTSGARLVQAAPPLINSLIQYGQSIGLAFQIVDDILDIEGQTETLGKTSGSDEAHQKSTYPALLGLEASKEKARGMVDQALASIAHFSTAADPLRAIAHYIIQRQS